jgi:hypothetical protein
MKLLEIISLKKNKLTCPDFFLEELLRKENNNKDSKFPTHSRHNFQGNDDYNNFII